MREAKRQLLMFILGNIMCPPGSAYAANMDGQVVHAANNAPAVVVTAQQPDTAPAVCPDCSLEAAPSQSAR
jgi:hypothetical protein